MEKGEGSPSVQVKTGDIEAAHKEGMHYLKKISTSFGEAGIVTLTPEYLPTYLRDHDAFLKGKMDTKKNGVLAKIDNPSLWQYCVDQGFFFEPDILARYVASIITKPFVILAGVSGTGKSKIAELVAEFYSRVDSANAPDTSTPTAPLSGSKFLFVESAAKGAVDRSRFALVPVRPDWIDNQSILGFVNPLTGRYESTQAFDLMLRADHALKIVDHGLDAPRYFMLLDEMNLARVEHYFSDWLACSESRRYGSNAKITQQPVSLHRHESAKTSLIDVDGTAIDVDVPNTLGIPTNLVVTGTVNVDETTFSFSPKVLDRSMVIEFNDVDLDMLRDGMGTHENSNYRFPTTLPPFELPTVASFTALPQATHNHLVAVNKILAEAQLHFGYRSAAEMSVFIRVYNNILPDDATDVDLIRALDGAILQKVLPRVQGNRARIENALCVLIYFLHELEPPPQPFDLDTTSFNTPPKLKQSYARAKEMLGRLRDFGFVTFFK